MRIVLLAVLIAFSPTSLHAQRLSVADTRYHASDAAILVHSFGPERASFSDYRQFLALFGKSGDAGQLTALGIADGVRLWAGWAQGDPKFLEA